MIALLLLVKICAPSVAPDTMLSIIATESSGKPFVINDNTSKKLYKPTSEKEAVSTAYNLIKLGHNLDFGLTQINIKNAEKYHLTLNEIFDPCENIKYGSLILTEAYLHSVRNGDKKTALLRSFSLYNTGNSEKGFKNGYVGKVLKNAKNQSQ